jgi:hypothetical protein
MSTYSGPFDSIFPVIADMRMLTISTPTIGYLTSSHYGDKLRLLEHQ